MSCDDLLLNAQRPDNGNDLWCIFIILISGNNYIQLKILTRDLFPYLVNMNSCVQLSRDFFKKFFLPLLITKFLLQLISSSSFSQVRDLVEKCTCPSQFPMIRVSEGKYRIGDTKVLIFVRVSIYDSHVKVARSTLANLNRMAWFVKDHLINIKCIMSISLKREK